MKNKKKQEITIFLDPDVADQLNYIASQIKTTQNGIINLILLEGLRYSQFSDWLATYSKPKVNKIKILHISFMHGSLSDLYF